MARGNRKYEHHITLTNTHAYARTQTHTRDTHLRARAVTLGLRTAWPTLGAPVKTLQRESERENLSYDVRLHSATSHQFKQFTKYTQSPQFTPGESKIIFHPNKILHLVSQRIKSDNGWPASVFTAHPNPPIHRFRPGADGARRQQKRRMRRSATVSVPPRLVRS